MSALTDLFTAFANKIRSKTGGSDTYTPPQMVDAIDDVYQAGVDAGTTPTQTKTVTAGTSATTVTPDAGYALSSVTVNPTPSQSKSATPTTSSQTITPDSGKLLSSVSVGAIQTETKSDTPNVSTNKTVSPSSGKYLSQVTIQPLTHSGTYTPAANTAQNDMGAYHDKRYVNTSGMIVPSGAKSITANGTGIDVSSYATANVNVPNPTLSGNATAADVANGKTFYNNTYTKQTGSYVAPTINNITPSDSSPASMTANSNYKPSKKGYAIESYENVTPTANGEYFSNGIKSMSQPGWVYSQKPTLQETTLWTNSSPTSNFAGQAVTLSQNGTNFDLLKVYFKQSTSSSSVENFIMFDLNSLIDNTNTRVGLNTFESSSPKQRVRVIASDSGATGSIYFDDCYKLATSSGQTGGSKSNTNCIPTKITGVKLP